MKGFFFLGLSQITLQDGLWSGVQTNFITTFLATVALSFLAWVAVRLTRVARHLLKAA